MAAVRPAMHARDSSGRQVSLLNDEPGPSRVRSKGRFNPRLDERLMSRRSNSYNSESSSPTTPDLLRSDSYDSRASNDPNSPLTPSLMEYGRPDSYDTSYPDPTTHDSRLECTSIYGILVPPQSSASRPPYAESKSSKFEDDETIGGSSERKLMSSGKRYPCRHNTCDKTFTTSGHASRHSKIHTAEKAVPCAFPGCEKKFTRADNMKQHLETHYKERTRSASHKLPISSTTKLTVPAGVKKSHLPGSKFNQSASSSNWQEEQLALDISATFSNYLSNVSSYVPQSPATSPKSGYGPLDMGNFTNTLPVDYPRAPPGSCSSSALDALALIAASKAGSK